MPITNELNLPAPFVDAVTRDYKYKDKRYSVTSLLKGTREAILQRRHSEEIITDVSDSVWMIFGSAVHSILENANETETQLKENWITVDMPNGYTLSGIFDLYDDSTGTVTDYKTASVWKAIYNEWDDYRKQLLIYCWMLREMGFDAHTGEIVALLKDHSKSKAKFDRDYPQHPVVVKRFEFTDNEFDEIGMWLESKFREIEACEKLPDDKLPICSPEERWYKPGKWSVTKKGNKKATKLFDEDKEAEAREYADYLSERDGKPYEVELRVGKDGKCEDYCSVCEFCKHWRECNENQD